MRSCSNIVGIYTISWCNISEKNALSQFPALRTGDCESALFALLFTHSLFWHMHWLARRKTNDKTQLSASFPWGVKKTQLSASFPWGLKKPKKTKETKKTKNNKKKQKKTKKKTKTCPQCLQSLEIFVFFVFFWFFVFFSFFVFFWFFWFFLFFFWFFVYLDLCGIFGHIVAYCGPLMMWKHCKTLQGKQCKTHGRTASFSAKKGPGKGIDPIQNHGFANGRY